MDTIELTLFRIIKWSVAANNLNPQSVRTHIYHITSRKICPLGLLFLNFKRPKVTPDMGFSVQKSQA